MGIHPGSFNSIRKRFRRYIIPFCLVAVCIIAIALALGLRSYAASTSFNPDVQLGILNSSGTLESTPSFKVGQTYEAQLSAVLPSAQQVSVSGRDFALGAQVAGGVDTTELDSIGTWVEGGQYAPALAGISLAKPYNSSSNNSVGIEEQVAAGNLGGLSFSGLGSGTNIWSGPGAQWDLTFTSSFISFLEQYGHKAATFQSPTASAQGLQAGERFGITFYIKIASSTDSGKNRLTAYGGFASSPSQSMSSWSGLSTASISMAPPEYKNDGSLNVQLGEVKDGLLSDEQTLALPKGSSLDLQASAPLPDPFTMMGQTQYFAFKLLPFLGLTLANLKSVKIAGIPLSSLPAGWQIESSAGTNPDSVSGSRFAYWVVELTAGDILEIEKNGFAPASPSHLQATAAGISVGSPFAVTFTGEISSSAPQTTSLEAIAGFKSPTAWSRLSPSPAKISISLEENEASQPQEDLEINLLDSSGLVDTSSPHYYSTKLETSSDPSTMIDSSTGKFRFQVVATLPNPAAMKGEEENLVIKNIPGVGLAVPNPAYSKSNLATFYSIAGQPLGGSRLKPIFEVSSKDENPMIEGSSDGSSYWQLVLTPSEIEELEQDGSSPATSSSPQGASGLYPGEKFAIVFNGFVTNKASGTVTDQVQLSWAAGSSSALGAQQLISSKTLSLYPEVLSVSPSANLNVLTQGYINQNPYTGLQTPIQFQLESALPNPSEMTGKYASFDLVDTPGAGVSVENPQSSPSDFELAGLPILSIPGVKLSASSPNAWIEGNGAESQSFTVELSAASVKYIEEYGCSPATRSAVAGTKAGINPGSLFALVFTGELNSSAPVQQSYRFDRGYSAYEGNINGKSYEDKSLVASVGIKYNGISTPLTAQLNVINPSTGLLERNPVYSPGESIEFQLTVTLPNPSSLVNTSAAAESLTIPGWYGIQISPGEGVEVQTFLSDSTYVAGIQFQGNSTLQGDSTAFGGLTPQQQEANQQYIAGSSSNSSTIPSKDSTYWGLAFNSAGIKYIEENGQAAATFSSKAYKPSDGLKPGDKFAITFYGQLASAASGNLNALYGFAGYQSNFPQDPDMSSGWWILCNGQGPSTVNYIQSDEMWKYERSSYKSAVLYLPSVQVSSPTSSIQVISGGKVQPNPKYPQSSPIDFRISSTLPSPGEMKGSYRYFRLDITPKSGISIYNGALAKNSSYFTVEGVALSSIPGVKVLSSSASSSVESGGSLSIVFSPASITYLISKGLAKAGSLEIEAVGFLNQSASLTPNSNQIFVTSSLAPTETGTFTLQSGQSEINVAEEEEESIKTLPYTGNQEISMFMLSVFGVLLMAAGVGTWEITKRLKRK